MATVRTANTTSLAFASIRDAQELGFTLKEIHDLVKIHETANAPANSRASGQPGWQEAFRIARQRLALIDKKIDQFHSHSAAAQPPASTARAATNSTSDPPPAH